MQQLFRAEERIIEDKMYNVQRYLDVYMSMFFSIADSGKHEYTEYRVIMCLGHLSACVQIRYAIIFRYIELYSALIHLRYSFNCCIWQIKDQT